MIRRINLARLSIDDLIQRYVQIGLEQYEALLDLDTRRFNRLFDRMIEVEQELGVRGRDARLQLLTLYEHPNAQVRLNAFKETLAVAPKQARKALEELADSVEYPQAGDAGMCLWALDEGIFKPT